MDSLSQTTDRRAAVEKYGKAIESWKELHDDAMECWKYEDVIAEMSGVLRRMAAANSRLRRDILRGSEAFYEAVEPLGGELREFFARWLAVTERLLAVLPTLELAYGHIEGADEFRACHEVAESVLANWTPPARSSSPGMQPWELTQDEADSIAALDSAPPGTPGKIAGPLTRVSLGPASLIR